LGELFGTDGIRGEANLYPMDAHTALAIGQAVALLFKGSRRAPRIVIGRDTRLSGPMLEAALQAGVISMGGEAYLVGVLPTPGIAFVTQSMRAEAGAVISASHNPAQDNGIKIFSGAGMKLSDEQEARIEELVVSGETPRMVPQARGIGRPVPIDDATGRYIVFLKGTLPRPLSLEGLKIVLDTGNGATYEVAPAAFSELGAEVVVLHDRPDGHNINDDCGSQHTQDLRGAVVEHRAHLGLAFDGDGDRLIAVDEKGKELSGDQTLLACALWLRERGRLKNDLIVATVMSNMGLHVACQKMGLKVHEAKVGDRQVLEDMIRLGGVIGGEQSGHMIFLDRHSTGDGILSGIQLVAAMIDSGKPLSELAGAMEVFPQKLMNVEVKSKPEISTVPQIVDAIRQVETDLKGKGRVLVRYSGTQRMCRVMVEGPTEEITEKYAQQLAEVVRAAIG
jgi:phosphoglucosamine mutase